jgi:hypothetical protein
MQRPLFFLGAEREGGIVTGRASRGGRDTFVAEKAREGQEGSCTYN